MIFCTHPRINQQSIWIQSIIDHINLRNGEELSRLEDIDPIYLHTFHDTLTIHPERRNMNGTFGFNFITSIGQNQFAHIIAINQDACSCLNLSINEIGAVTLHELGHIYNELPTTLVERISFGMKPNAKKEYKYNLELRADCFAAKFGFRDELISALTKSLGSDLYVSIHDELQRRITELQTDNYPYLDGKYKVASF
ncbi:hypothetical protein LJC38_02625 [Parabacteroides sp. OttesenSCG-928-K15]|nr:hypothetical protein [Parabacteroides sp. OttesenSCG-928-K15]